jgi:hypothetical protein
MATTSHRREAGRFQTEPVTIAELDRVLHAADPSMRLVAPRLIRRSLRRLGLRSALGPRAVYRTPVIIDRETARSIFDRDAAESSIVDAGEFERPDDPLILFALPDEDRLARRQRGAVLLGYWRRLFAARYRIDAERSWRSLPDREPRQRRLVAEIGVAPFAEAKNVLIKEGILFAPYDELAVIVAWQATFHELTLFQADWLADWFPAIDDHERVRRLLSDPGPPPALLAATTRPEGAPDPEAYRERLRRRAEGAQIDKRIDEIPLSKLRRRWIAERVKWSSTRGNDVRAAILKTWEANRSVPADAEKARAAARESLNRLARRLRVALAIQGAEAAAWRRGFTAMIDRAAEGYWPPEARWLYAIQKVCFDHEHEFHAVEPLAWLFSLGKRPLKRTLIHHDQVAIARRLRSARNRLAKTRLADVERAPLERLLDNAIDRAEERLRETFRPLIAAVVPRSLPEPANVVERVAIDKLVEELLDVLAERGFLQMGDVRDAISQSPIKLPDLSGPIELVLGDPLLRLDRALAKSLDEVYRRGEIYRRLLQKGSSLAFGTKIGRFLTLFGAIPFGGSFVILAGTHHIALIALKLTGGGSIPPFGFEAILAGGLFILCIIHIRAFRKLVVRVLRGAARGIRLLFFDLPAAIAAWPALRRIWKSLFIQILWRALIKPMLLVAPFTPLIRRFDSPTTPKLEIFCGLTLIVAVFINTRFGRDFEEVVVDAAARGWRRFRSDLIPGLLRFVIEIFQIVVEAIDRTLHAVDEYLRFRTGQSRAALVAKATLGLAWEVVAYIIRLYVNLLIEPQINPIKHFPVVTVSHKIILPMSLRLTRAAAAPLKPVLGPVLGNAIAGTTVLLLPGVFGFLVWELKENWRLYAANRPTYVVPVSFGGHGETMARMFRPGFHSGTIPKLFAKLRSALRDAAPRGDASGPVASRRSHLHEAELAIRRFIDRDILAPAIAAGIGPIAIESVQLATDRAVVRFQHQVDSPEFAISTDPPVVVFEEIAGKLLVQVHGSFLANSSAKKLDDLGRALVDGLIAMSGADLDRGALERLLSPHETLYDIDDQGVTTILDDDRATTAFRAVWSDRDSVAPVLESGSLASSPPAIDPRRFVVDRESLRWNDWVERMNSSSKE